MIQNKEKEKYYGGFKLTGNSMSLKLNDTEYETTPDLVHFILSGNGVEDGGKGIFVDIFLNLIILEIKKNDKRKGNR